MSFLVALSEKLSHRFLSYYLMAMSMLIGGRTYGSTASLNVLKIGEPILKIFKGEVLSYVHPPITVVITFEEKRRALPRYPSTMFKAWKNCTLQTL